MEREKNGSAVIDLSHADLSEADLSEANLHRAYLSEANLSGANLQWANLRSARLQLWDRKGMELTEYAAGEFEKLFSEQPVIELFYKNGLTKFELNTLPGLLQHLS